MSSTQEIEHARMLKQIAEAVRPCRLPLRPRYKGLAVHAIVRLSGVRVRVRIRVRVRVRRSSTHACSSRLPRWCGHATPTRGTGSGTSPALTGSMIELIDQGRGSTSGVGDRAYARMLKQIVHIT